MSLYATSNDLLEKEREMSLLRQKYQETCINVEEDIYVVIKTYNNFQAYLQVINLLPNYLDKVIKIEYVYFDKLILLINKVKLTQDNFNEIKTILMEEKKFGFYDKFDYQTLPNHVLLI